MRLRPKQRIILNAIKHEAHLKKRGRSLTKRFRSWSQTRMRALWMPYKVNLRCDPTLMDGQYLAGCFQKAATTRKHDAKLWGQYATRCINICHTLNPYQLQYIFYGIGKSFYLHKGLYESLIDQVNKQMYQFHSRGLMSVMWALDRVNMKVEALADNVLRFGLANAHTMRPSDFSKICGSYAKMGGTNRPLMNEASEIMVDKFEKMTAHEFRDVMQPLPIIQFYNDRAKEYIFNRFQKIFITCRPHHYRDAFESAVCLRVLCPDVWHQLPKQVKTFYIRLSMRRITQQYRVPSEFHWDVSNCLANINLAHRNLFQWGCFWIDIGEFENKSNCWFVDGPSSYYFNSNIHTERNKLRHKMLTELGWNVRRVAWYKWVYCNTQNEKEGFVRNLSNTPAIGSELSDEALTEFDFQTHFDKLRTRDVTSNSPGRYIELSLSQGTGSGQVTQSALHK